MQSICIFCGSSSGRNLSYRKAAVKLGRLLSQKNLTLVYGGGNIGLMGEIAQSVLNRGGKAIGVIPQFLVEKELVYNRLTEVHVVDSMHERKALMAKLADGFIAMPGGFGTLEEIVEVLTWAQLGLHRKPIGLLNIDGYFDSLNHFFGHMVNEGFLMHEHKDMLAIRDDPASMLESLLMFKPPIF